MPQRGLEEGFSIERRRKRKKKYESQVGGEEQINSGEGRGRDG